MTNYYDKFPGYDPDILAPLEYEEPEGEEFNEPEEDWDPDTDEFWYWLLRSGLYGVTEFGPYGTQDEAYAGIASVQATVKGLRDGVLRWYSAPYQGKGYWDDELEDR